MTTEESEQLIAEIKSKSQKAEFPFDRHDNYTDLVATIVDIEKIIKRFANKPPYILKIQHDIETDTEITLDFSELNNIATLGIKMCDEFVCGTSLDSKSLKQLRDNIDKMLEYLNNE